MKKLGILFLLGGATVLWHLVKDSTPPVRPQVNNTTPMNTMVPLEPGSQEIVSLQRVKDYYAPHYLAEQLVWEARGAVADVYGEERAVVTDPQITFYEKRRADGTQQQVHFVSQHGEITRRKGMASLSGAVTAVTDDGTRLDSPALIAEFADKRVYTDEDVIITRPKMEIRGRQLDGSIKLEKFSLRQGIRMVLHGTDLDFLGRKEGAPTVEDNGEPAVRKPRPAAADDPAGEETLIITSDGPLTMERLEADEVTKRMRHRVTIKDNVLLLRQQLQEVTTSLSSNTIEIVLIESKGPKGESRLEVELLHSTGNSRVTDRRGSADADSVILANASSTTQTMSFTGPYKWFTLQMPHGFSLTPGAAPADSAGNGTVNASSGPAGAAPQVMEITCAGNARFLKGRKGDKLAQSAEFENQVLVKNGTMSLLCRHLLVDFAPPSPGQGAAGGGPEVSALTAEGEALFVDEQVTARSDKLEWDRAHQGIRLSGDRPAEVLQNLNSLRGRRIVIDQAARLVTCEEDATSVVQLPKGSSRGIMPGAGGAGGGDTWTVTARRQEIRFGEGMKTLDSLIARGDVGLVGGKQHARADALTWISADDRMTLEGKPFARIVDRDNTIESSAIVIRPKLGQFQLQGRKLVTVNHASGMPGSIDRKVERISITCDGPAVITDGGSRMHFLNHVVVRREGGRITCDRMLAFINTDRNEVERVVANDNVVIADPAGTALAAFLAWNMTTREFLLRRHPYAQVWHDGSYFFGEEITASQDWRNVTAINRKGRGRILVREGTKLAIPGERPPAGTSPTPGRPPTGQPPNQPPDQPAQPGQPDPTKPPPEKRRPDRR